MPCSPKRRETYFEAVALYEQGLEALQRHAYQEATHLLESVLRQFPEERELHERVRLYGGELWTGERNGGGFEIRARIPLEAEVTPA